MEQILSYETLFFIIIIAISCAFSLVMNKSLHAALVKIYTSRSEPQLLLFKCITYCLTVLLHLLEYWWEGSTPTALSPTS